MQAVSTELTKVQIDARLCVGVTERSHLNKCSQHDMYCKCRPYITIGRFQATHHDWKLKLARCRPILFVYC